MISKQRLRKIWWAEAIPSQDSRLLYSRFIPCKGKRMAKMSRTRQRKSSRHWKRCRTPISTATTQHMQDSSTKNWTKVSKTSQGEAFTPSKTHSVNRIWSTCQRSAEWARNSMRTFSKLSSQWTKSRLCGARSPKPWSRKSSKIRHSTRKKTP